MSYRTRRKSSLASKSKRNFVVSLILIFVVGFATIQWILPTLVNGVGFIKGIVKPSTKNGENITENVSLAPPVLNIPFEATSTSQINISGFSIPNARVKLFLDDQEAEEVDVSSDGSFVFTNISLNLGTNNIYGKSVDETGRESLPSKTIKVLYDSEKPSLQIAEPEDNKTIQGGDKKVKFAGTTDFDSQILINGSQVVVNSEGKFETTLSLNDGENNFTVRSQDLAGNFTEISRKVTYNP